MRNPTLARLEAMLDAFARPVTEVLRGKSTRRGTNLRVPGTWAAYQVTSGAEATPEEGLGTGHLHPSQPFSRLQTPGNPGTIVVLWAHPRQCGGGQELDTIPPTAHV